MERGKNRGVSTLDIQYFLFLELCLAHVLSGYQHRNRVISQEDVYIICGSYDHRPHRLPVRAD